MIKNWIGHAAHCALACIGCILMRRSIATLLALDDRSLSAIELSRTDVIDCLAAPASTDPFSFLAKRCAQHRRVNQARGLARSQMRDDAMTFDTQSHDRD